jgi:hypothetical protein
MVVQFREFLIGLTVSDYNRLIFQKLNNFRIYLFNKIVRDSNLWILGVSTKEVADSYEEGITQDQKDAQYEEHQQVTQVIQSFYNLYLCFRPILSDYV